MPALVAGVASIPLVYAVGVRTVGRGAGLLAAALTTLSPFMIFYSAEARGYGVLMALVLASTLALLIALDDGQAAGGWPTGCVSASPPTPTTRRSSCWRPVRVGVLGPSPVVPALAGRHGRRGGPLPPVAPQPQSRHRLTDHRHPQRLLAVHLDGVRLTLGHWSIGFPFCGPARSLGDLPGTVALLLLVISIGVGAAGSSRCGPGSGRGSPPTAAASV